MRKTYEVGKKYLFVQVINQDKAIADVDGDLLTRREGRQAWLHDVKSIKITELKCVSHSLMSLHVEDTVDDHEPHSYRFKDHRNRNWALIVRPEHTDIKFDQNHAAQIVPLDPGEREDFDHPSTDLEVLLAHLEDIIRDDAHEHPTAYQIATANFKYKLMELVHSRSLHVVNGWTVGSVKLEKPTV